MKTNYFYIFIFLLIFTGCIFDKSSNGNGGGVTPPAHRFVSMTSDEIDREGWSSFQSKDYTNAEECFTELTIRDEVYLRGHYGLGWTFIKTYKYLNAKNEFAKFFELDSLGVYVPADSVSRNVRAGQTIVLNALLEHPETLQVSNTFNANTPVNNNWRFRYDTSITIFDIRLLRAISQVALGQLENALQTVQLLDPEFIVNINTIEGRLMLMQKIEELSRNR